MGARTVKWGPVVVAAGIMGADLALTGWYHALNSPTLIINRGIGFGLLAHSPVAAYLGVAAGFAALFVGYRRWPGLRYPMAVIGGGALANLASRLFYGGVIDYWRYPYTFNAADVAIRAGVLYLLVTAWKQRGVPSGANG